MSDEEGLQLVREIIARARAKEAMERARVEIDMEPDGSCIIVRKVEEKADG